MKPKGLAKLIDPTLNQLLEKAAEQLNVGYNHFESGDYRTALVLVQNGMMLSELAAGLIEIVNAADDATKPPDQ